MTNFRNLTFKQLKEMVGKVPAGKMPGKKQVLEVAGEVLFTGMVGGADVTIYKSGYIVYSRGENTTVFAVDRCEYVADETQEDDKDMLAGLVEQGFEIKHFGKKTFICTPARFYEDCPWDMVIGQICDHRLDHNQEERENSKIEFRIENDSWDPALSVPDFVEARMKEEEEEAKKISDSKRLAAAKQKLTDRQLEIVEKYYSTPGMTEQKLADELGITQQGVHKILAAAITKLQKNF